MINAAVLISGSGSNLQALIDQSAAGEMPAKIKLVISNNPDAFGLERAKQAGIPSIVVRHTDFNSREEFDRAMSYHLDQAKVDLVILAGFMRILSEFFVENFQERLINIHPSLLPKFPGTNTHSRVLEAGEEWHGASIHFVVPEVDAGPIILQGRIKVRENDTAESLQQRVHKVEHQIYPLAVSWFAANRLTISGERVLLDDEISAEQLQTFEL